jgi:aryl-alcohol dehydrogenase-like predicted oxidoreductase
MALIEKFPFGNTGHMSTRAIFGSVCLRGIDQKAADEVLDLLLEFGINHIDTAPAYGDAELRVGPWMKQHRDRFFLATKTDQRTYPDAREQFYRSLDRLQVDRVDLLQMHNLTDVVIREIAMGPGGALQFLVEAREKGLVRYIGITGHGILAPKMHLQSLARFDFDTVLAPCNYLLMQNPKYRSDFYKLITYCREHNIAVQTIKSAARGLWGDKPRGHSTWYEPLNDEEAVKKAVQWVMGDTDAFLITTGDLQVLPKFLAAAAGYQKAPANEMMEAMVAEQEMQPLFDQL